MRQLITESILLSLAGGIAGLALSVVATKLLRVEVTQMLTTQLGSDFAFSLNLNPDVRVLAYALVLSVIAGVVFGLSPALQFTKPELATSLTRRKHVVRPSLCALALAQFADLAGKLQYPMLSADLFRPSDSRSAAVADRRSWIRYTPHVSPARGLRR